MEELNEICHNHPMAVTMWKALFDDPFLQEARDVQVPDSQLGGPNALYYNERFHKGALTCAYCDAGVHYNAGSESTAGSTFAGRSPHFVTDVFDVHADDCLWQLREPGQSIQAIDPAKGYRIHLNTQRWSELFNKASGVYGRDKNGRVIILDEDMRMRERLAVTNIDQLIGLMGRGEYSRLRNSRVVFRNESVPWDRFCIHNLRPKSYFDLLDDVKSGGVFPPVMMQIETKGIHSFRGFGEQKIYAKPILMAERDDRGRKQEIQPVVEIRNRDNTHVMQAFSDKGSYFVLGQVRYGIKQGDYKTVHYFNIAVTNAEQVVFADIYEIAEMSRARSRSRAEAASYSPSPSE